MINGINISDKRIIDNDEVEAAIRLSENTKEIRLQNLFIKTQKKQIMPRSIQQEKYIGALKNKILTFGLGPAGTGKTYLIAKVIYSLLKDGKRVAITANSHKVIHNLLDRIEENALFDNFKFEGLKKRSSNRNF